MDVCSADSDVSIIIDRRVPSMGATAVGLKLPACSARRNAS
jgi:hypothetical protein